MKTRTALIYLVLFLILAGYFYYFEVIRREARLKQEEAAQHLFQLDKTQVTDLKLDKADSKPISLKKNDRWLIVEPLHTRSDESVVGSLLTSLQALKMDRQVEDDAKDLKPYGLDKPNLHLSFLDGGSWHHLRIGTKAALGDKFYASGDQQNRVVLIAGSQKRQFDKSLFDLRSKELFTLKSEDVDRIEIERSNHKLVFAQTEKGRWQSSADPKLKIKKSKVENLLNRLVWLRAIRFINTEKGNAAEFGFDPARVRVGLATREKTETVLLGKTEKDEGIYAKAEGLPGMAVVDEKLLEDLPANPSDLKDRTLLEFELAQIMAIKLALDRETVKLERAGEKWEWAGGDSDRKDPESWLVNSLLWKLQEMEHLPGTAAQEQSPPEKRQLTLIVFSESEEKLGTFLLPEVPSEKVEQGTLWFFKGDEAVRPYWVNGEVLRSLYSSASRLVTPES